MRVQVVEHEGCGQAVRASAQKDARGALSSSLAQLAHALHRRGQGSQRFCNCAASIVIAHWRHIDGDARLLVRLRLHILRAGMIKMLAAKLFELKRIMQLLCLLVREDSRTEDLGRLLKGELAPAAVEGRVDIGLARRGNGGEQLGGGRRGSGDADDADERHGRTGQEEPRDLQA